MVINMKRHHPDALQILTAAERRQQTASGGASSGRPQLQHAGSPAPGDGIRQAWGRVPRTAQFRQPGVHYDNWVREDP